jgi:hypothetical protein
MNALRRCFAAASDRATNLRDKLTGRERVHFLHIGKTGGTAVKHALRKHRCSHRYRLVFHPHQTTLQDIPPGERVVFALRDPISRFVSAFLSRQRQGQPRYFYPWSQQEQLAFATFATPDELGVALSSTDETLRNRAEDAMRSINHLKSHYRRWLGSKDDLLSRRGDILIVLFQENLDADFRRLRHLLDLDESAALPTDERAAHRNPSALNRALTPPALDNLAAWYSADFELLEICRRLTANRPPESSNLERHQ